VTDDQAAAVEDDASPQSLDLTTGQPPERLPIDRPLVATPDFNPRRIQERVRTGVAAAVVGAVILETLVLLFAYAFGTVSATSLPAVTTAIITPLVGIAGTVLGFYFGSHRHDDGGGT
jgi:hypothetical protein